jgi:rhodanese-related sulfurtransferase
MFFGPVEPSLVPCSTVGLLGLARINDKNEQILSSGELRIRCHNGAPQSKMAPAVTGTPPIDSIFGANLRCISRPETEATMGYTITPTELKSRLDKGDQLVLLDVREQWEFDLAKLNGSTLIPLATLPNSLGKLSKDTEIIAICHHGMRSADATNFLLQQGFPNVKNLVGGIDAWSALVDRSVPRY